MPGSEVSVVTGAFGYTGYYIARRLLSLGHRVRTLTGHPERPNPFRDRVEVAPFNFDHPQALSKSLQGAAILYNTYWIRFPYGDATFEKAIENTKILLRAAEEAGVRKIVHLSVTQASARSPLPYFKGKGIVEEAIESSKLHYAILRPTVIFGQGDILINNIAWLLRHFPVFAIPGSGSYRLQPVSVEDVAQLAVEAGAASGNTVTDAAGPEIFTYEGLVRLIAERIGSRARILHLNPRLALSLARLVGYAVGDVLITRDELQGLMAGLLVSDGPPAGRTHLGEWLEQNADTLGATYASELQRHYR